MVVRLKWPKNVMSEYWMKSMFDLFFIEYYKYYKSFQLKFWVCIYMMISWRILLMKLRLLTGTSAISQMSLCIHPFPLIANVLVKRSPIASSISNWSSAKFDLLIRFGLSFWGASRFFLTGGSASPIWTPNTSSLNPLNLLKKHL